MSGTSPCSAAARTAGRPNSLATMDSPLLNVAGAVPAEGHDAGVAAHYGDPNAEQRALDLAAGLVDRSNRGVLRITGPDRLGWLHSLTTQHLERLGPGGAAEALILSPQGHIEHHLTLTDDGAATWVHVEPGTAADLLAFLESMRFMLRVEAADVSAEYAVLTLLGPDADVPLPDAAAAAIRGAFGIDVLVERGRLEAAAAGLREQGLALAGLQAYEALRIAAHRPRPGDGGPGTPPGPSAAAAGVPARGRQRGPAARA